MMTFGLENRNLRKFALEIFILKSNKNVNF